MASADRRYKKGQPIAIVARYGLKLPLLEHPELRTLMAWLIVRHASRCRVEVIDWCLMETHLHITVSQRFSGHDPKRRRGVGPFMRNVQSQFVLHTRRRYRIPGLRSECVYRSKNLETNGLLLAKQVYTDCNIRHHLGRPPSRATHSSWRAHTRKEPDGVITGLPTYFKDWSTQRISQLWSRIATEAIKRTAEQVPQPWLVATYEVVSALGIDVDLDAKPVIVPITEILDTKQHRRARRRRLRARIPAGFSVYPAPHLSAGLDRLARQASGSGPP